jgi:hypothetical protein
MEHKVQPNLPTSRNNESLEQLFNDVLKHGGIHIVGNKQVGKSNLKKTFASHVIKQHAETKLIIVDVEGKWQYDFSNIRYFTIPKNSINIVEEPIGRRLNGTIFTRKIYRLNADLEKNVLDLLRDNEPILFIVELEDTESCGYFSAFIISQIYDMQRISRKYWFGQLKRSYCIILEESENIFDSQSLEKKLFNSLRKKYNECANLRIGILSSSQRLTEVNKKFRGKMHGYLVGYTNPDDYIGQLGRILKKVSENPKQVLKPEFRYKFLYTATDQILTFPLFKQHGKPYLWVKPKPKPEQKPEPKPQKKRLIDKLRDFFNPKEQQPQDDYINIIEPQEEETEEFDDIDSESEIEIDESEWYPEEW